MGFTKIGAAFTSRTTTLKACVALRLGKPLSETTSMKRLVVPPCASPVCQLIDPLFASSDAPAGATGNAKVNPCFGRSLSTTVGVKANSAPSLIAMVAIGTSDGTVLGPPAVLVCASGAAGAISGLPASSVATL